MEGAGERVHISTLTYGLISISEDGQISKRSQDELLYHQVFEKNGKAIYAKFNKFVDKRQNDIQNIRSIQSPSYPLYFYTDKEALVFPGLDDSNRLSFNAEALQLGQGKYLFQVLENVWLIENGKKQWKTHFPFRIQYARLINKGQLYLGLYGHEGLRVYKDLEAFRKNGGSTWLPGKSVNHFMEDREGSWWFATHEDGVFYASAEAFMVHDRETGLPVDKVTTLAIKNEKELYAGLENGEVWSLNPEAGIWKKLPIIPGKNAIRDLYFDQQNQQLWVGRDKLYFQRENEWIPHLKSKDQKSFAIADRLVGTPDGQHLWLCNYEGFTNIKLTQKFQSQIDNKGGSRVFVVREDFSGRVWVGQSQGLLEWKNEFLYNRQNLHSAFSSRVEDIILLADSTLVVGTKGDGIVFWKDSLFQQITTEENLTSNMLECLYADEEGVVWAGTLNGLNRISGSWENRQVDHFTISKGLPSNEINRVLTFGKNVYVATNKGLVHFSDKNKNLHSPQPILNSVLVNNHPVDFTKPLQLQWKENNLSINYFAINYKMNGNIPFHYRMDGGDWVKTLNRTLNFPALSPGERFFEVKAQNEDGVLSKSTTLQFIINPPWWATWWAKAGVSLIGLFLIFAVYKYRTVQFKKEHRIQLQIAELKRSALQAQMNPHFIFNCLNSIQNFILQNEKESAITYLGSFASLVRSILNASVSGKITLDEEIKLLSNYLELEKLRFKNRFNYEIRTAEGLDFLEIKIPPLLIQPFVENALKHGISNKTNGGKVDVFFEEKETYLEVSIADNGVGIKAAEKLQTGLKSHKSFGMMITQDRLKLISNKKDNNSISTNTLYDENDQIAGTQIIIKIGIN